MIAPEMVDVGRDRQDAQILQGRDPEMKADQPVRLAIRQRLEQDSVDDGEHRGVGADPQRQRQNGRGGEGWIPC